MHYVKNHYLFCCCQKNVIDAGSGEGNLNDIKSLQTKMTIIDSDERFPYSKSKIKIFSQNRKKNQNLDFITSLCIDFY